MPNTVRLHRVLTTKPEKIYRAFTEADAMAKWLPPNGFTCTVHHMEAKIGGSYRMSFRNFTTGLSHAFGGQFLELVPGERLRYTDKFDDPNLPGEIHVTVSLKKHDIVLTVVDDGRGFDLGAARGRGGLGLVGMEERARLVHGKLSIAAGSNRGTRISLQVPLGDGLPS